MSDATLEELGGFVGLGSAVGVGVGGAGCVATSEVVGVGRGVDVAEATVVAVAGELGVLAEHALKAHTPRAMYTSLTTIVAAGSRWFEFVAISAFGSPCECIVSSAGYYTTLGVGRQKAIESCLTGVWMCATVWSRYQAERLGWGNGGVARLGMPAQASAGWI